MLRRPWAIDDERLRAIVEHPPASHASILGALLSIRFADWVHQALAVMAARCADSPPPGHDPNARQGLLDALATKKVHYETRTAAAILELGGLFDVDEPDAGLDYEIGRWRCMLYDYTCALDMQLHERLEALGTRYAAEPSSLSEAWDDLGKCRQIDTCVGLLLAYAAMRDPGPRSNIGFVDAMATDAIGSFAWWCRCALDTWEEDHTLGARMKADEVEMFVYSAHHALAKLDPGLLAAVLRLFPAIEP
jgi:hypothetical protein